jgi:hypothetical protein
VRRGFTARAADPPSQYRAFDRSGGRYSHPRRMATLLSALAAHWPRITDIGAWSDQG